MSWLKKLFGGSEKDTPKKTPGPQKSNTNTFLTNAGEYGFAVELSIAGVHRIDVLLAISKLEEAAKQKGDDLEWKVMYTNLLHDGALTVPLVFASGGKKYSAFFIYTHEDMLKYLDMRERIKETEHPNLIYFSSIPISAHYTPGKCVEPFQLADLRGEKNAQVSGEFAAWEATIEDPDFLKSETFNLLSKWYELLEGYNTYALGYLLRQTRMQKDNELRRTGIPEGWGYIVITAPEGKTVVLAIDQKAGIRFLFPVGQTTNAYRERFLKGALVDLIATLLPLRQQGAEKDPESGHQPRQFFHYRADRLDKLSPKQRQRFDVAHFGNSKGDDVKK